MLGFVAGKRLVGRFAVAASIQCEPVKGTARFSKASIRRIS
jgi:hypothetical protein